MSNLESRCAKPKINALVQAHFLRLLYDNPHTITELSEEIGLSPNVVRGYMRALRKRKLVYLVDKAPDLRGQRTIDVWHWGPDKRDRYKKTSVRDRQRNYRARKRARLENKVLAGISATGTMVLQAGACDLKGKS
jgi:DNA-binding transcriptional ArsR family regulator